MYYLCDYQTHRAMKEFILLKDVVNYINESNYPELFCSMSRYALAKEKRYPNTVEGDRLLQEDLSKKYVVAEWPERIFIYSE